MKSLVALFLVLINSPIHQSQYVDRQCGGNIDNLWLDIVFVVDNSKGMTDDGLAKIAANIASLFTENTRFGVNHTDPRTTRLALVTYNEVANTVLDFDAIASLDDVYEQVFTALSSVSQSGESYLGKGIGEAETVLQNGRLNGYRSNYKRVVVVYASSYQAQGENDPRPIAERLLGSGVYISTVAFNQDGDMLKDLGAIASPGMSFTSEDLDLVGELQRAFITANCYCPDGWKQYSSEYGNAASYMFGVCIQPSTISASWMAAKMGCQNLHQSGHLVTEYDSAKHEFLYAYAQNLTNFQPPISYHIGLQYVNGGWYWEQNKQVSLVELQGNGTWNPGYPITSYTTNKGVGNVQDGSLNSVGWQNYNPYSAPQYYFCETISCDTEVYCAA